MFTKKFYKICTRSSVTQQDTYYYVERTENERQVYYY